MVTLDDFQHSNKQTENTLHATQKRLMSTCLYNISVIFFLCFGLLAVLVSQKDRLVIFPLGNVFDHSKSSTFKSMDFWYGGLSLLFDVDKYLVDHSPAGVSF
jgi:hypothetical protein